MNSDSLILITAFVALAMAVVSAGVTYMSVSSIMNQITGLALTDKATVNLTIESGASIVFTRNVINFSSGSITSPKGAYLDTQSGTVTGGNFTPQSFPLVLENNGNTLLNLSLSGTKTAATFFGGTDGVYSWNVSQGASNVSSCLNATIAYPAAFGAFAAVSTTPTIFCNPFNFTLGHNTIRIHFNITVPRDATVVGPTGDVITATATSYP